MSDPIEPLTKEDLAAIEEALSYLTDVQATAGEEHFSSEAVDLLRRALSERDRLLNLALDVEGRVANWRLKQKIGRVLGR